MWCSQDGHTAAEFEGDITIASSAYVGGGVGDFTLSGAITGTICVVQGSKTLTLSGNNTNLGRVAIYSGTAKLGAANALSATTQVDFWDAGILNLNGFNVTIGDFFSQPTYAGAVQLGGGTLTFGDDTNQTFNGVISGTGSVVKQGTGTETFTGANTYTGTTTISAGTLQIGDGGATGSLDSGSIVVNGTLMVNLSASLDMNSVISGSGTLIQNSDDYCALFLGASNTFSGTTRIVSGFIGLDNALALQNSTLDMHSGDTGTLLANGSLTSATLGNLMGSRNLVLENWYTAALALTVGNNNADSTYSGVLSGSGSLTKTGTGTLTLSGANTYTGTTTISEGTLSVSSIVVSGSSNLGNATSAVVLGDATHRGVLSYTGNAANYTRGFTVNAGGGEIDVTTTGQTLTVETGGISDGGSLTVGGAGNTSITSVISGTGSLTKTGTGVLTLSGTNTYTGATTIADGTISASNIVVSDGVSNLGNSASAVVLGDATHRGVLSYTGNNANYTRGFTVNAGGGEIDVTTTGQTLTVGTGGISGGGPLTIGGAGNTSISSVISGTGSLTKQGAGTLTLTGSNSYSGITTISAGTLQVGAGSTAGTLGSGGVTDNAILIFNRSDDLTVSNAISGTGTLTKQGAGTLTLTGSNSYSGVTTISAGTLQVGAGSTAGTLGSGSVTDNAALTFNRSDSITVSNAISGTGTVTKQGAGTLTLTGANSYSGVTTISAGTLQVGSGGTAGTLGSGSVTDNAALLFNRSDSITVGNAISGSGTLTKQGAGTLTLTGSNSYSSITTISAGTIQVGEGSTAGTLGSGSVTDNAALIFNRSDDLTVSNAISGSGTLTKQGAGTLTLTGANSYSGVTTISAGTLQVGSGGTAGTLGSGSVSDNAALIFNRSDSITVGNAISGSGTLTKQGAGTLTLTGSNSYSGITTISAGTIQVGAGSTSGTLGSGGVTDNAALTFNRSDDLTVSNAISGTGTLTKQGAGTLTLTGSNSYSGVTTISAGTLQVGAGSTAGTLGSGSVTDNAALTFNRSDSITVSNAISGTGTVTKQGAGTLTLTGANSYSGVTTISVGTLQVGSGGTAGTLGSGSVSDNAALIFNRSDSITVGNAISGSGTLTKQGAGTLTLTGSNSYSGITTISAGTIQVGAGSTAGTLGSGSVTDNAALIFNRSDDLTVSNAISGSGTLTKQGASTLTLTGNNSYSGTTTISAGTLQVGAGSTAGTLGSGSVTDNAALTFNRSDSITVSNSISGSGTLAQQGAGILTLSGTNIYTGNTTINAGTLQIGSTSALPSGVGKGNVNAGGTLDLNGYGITVNGLAGSGTVRSNVAGAVTFTVGANDQTTTFSGLIENGSGTIALTKTGAGTLTLIGNNTYSGTTTISAGTLQVGSGGTSGTLGSGSVTDNASLAFNRSNDFTVSNAIGGTGSLTKQGAGTLTLTGSNNYSGTTTISAGTLQVGAGSTAGTLGSGGVTDNAALVFNRSDSITVSSVISGSGTLTQQGTGTLILTGGNSYAGTTTISAGTLQVGSSGTSGTLGSGNVTNNATLVFNRSNSITVSNAISGSGALTQQGSDTLILTGSNSYSGTTIISAGTLQVGAGSTVGTLGSGGVTNNSSLVFNRSGSLTVGNTISGSGGVTKQGAGTLTLIGNNSYSGTTTISAGTLQVGSGGTAGTLGLGGITDNSALVFNRSDSITVSSDISGSGTLTQQGSGTLVLTGGNGYSGTTTISSGTLQVGSGGTSGTLGSGSVTDNASLVFNRSDSITVSNVVGGSGTLTQQSSGTLVLTGSNSYSGTTTISAGTLQVGAGSTTGMLGSGGVTNNGALVFNRSDSITVSNVISGSGTLTKQGAGALTLTGSNSYSGTTTISTGTLQVGAGSTAGTLGSGSVTDNAALVFNRSDSISVGNAISGSGTLTKQGAGTLTLTGSNGYSGTTTISAGTLQVGSGGTVGTLGTGNITNSSALTFNRSDSITVSNVISGSGTLTKQGAGTLTLTGSNSYSGVTTISAGTLQVGAGSTAGTLGSGGVTDNAILIFNRSDSITVSNAIGGSGTLTQQGGGTLTLTGSNSYSGVTTISAGTLQVGAGSTAGTLGSGGVADNAILIFNRSDSITVSNAISGSGTLTKQGASTLTLTGSNSYSGTTTISAGTLQVGAGSTSGTLGSGGVTDNAILIFNRSDDLTVSNAISGTGTLTKQGAGTLTLTGANSYSGVTTISTGTLQIGAGGTSGTLGSGSVTDNAALTFNRSDSITVSNAISGSGTLTKQGAGALTLTGSNSYSGVTTISAGTLQVGNVSALPSGAGKGNVAVNGTLDLHGYGITVNGLSGSGTVMSGVAGAITFIVGANDQTTTFSGVIQDGSGAVGLTKTGTGVLTLSGTNTYNGETAISAGTLSFANGALDSTDAIAFNGGTLRWASGNTEDISSHIVSLGSGKTAIFDTNGNNVTLASAISGDSAAGLTKTGAGVLTLSAINTYGGDTTVSAGTLQIGNASAIPNGANKGNVVVNGTLNLNGTSITVNGLSGSGTVTSGVAGPVTFTVGNNDQSGTFSGAIQNGSGTVAMTKTGTGVLTLSGSNTYEGETAINSGELRVTGTIASSTVTISGGTLSGTGYTGDVDATGGNLSPGVAAVGTLHTLDLTLGEDSSYAVELTNGGADRISVVGDVSLDDASLSLTSTRSHNHGSVLVLIQNDGSDSVTGNFLGLPEGAEVVVNNVTYFITYCYNAETPQFSTGNDVALVDDVPPEMSVSGVDTVPLDYRYVLTLGEVVDPDQGDGVTGYVIHWGDGQTSNYTPSQIETAGRQITHVYTDGPANPTIIVDLIDNVGTHTGVASQSVTVQVVPQMTLSGEDAALEGSLYTLTLGEMLDLGDETIDTYIIHWGDGSDDTICPANAFPANSEFTHVFSYGYDASGSTSMLISASLVGTAGTYDDVGHLAVEVSSRIATSAAATVDGNSVDLSVSANNTDNANLVYTWSVTEGSTEEDDPTFAESNGSSTAASISAELHRAGSYLFTVTITNADVE